MMIKYSLNDLIGSSSPIHNLKNSILDTAKKSGHVLIVGETGTGKEIVAHAIASLYLLREEDFIISNAAVSTYETAVMDLFGSNHGKSETPGKLAQAHGGILLIDSIDEIPIDLQLRLSCNLQNPDLHVRLLGITTKGITPLEKQNKLCPELYNLLKSINIITPPLEEHKEDIPDLIRYKIQKMNMELQKNIEYIDKEVYAYLYSKTWPGNVRELFNEIEKAAIKTNGQVLLLNAFK